MKKTLLTLLAFCALGIAPAAANDYAEKLVVTVNGVSTDSIAANITVVHEEDGTVTFSLKNFMLDNDGDEMPVGNITLKGVSVEKKNGYEAISTDQSITIEPGDLEGYGEDEWLGPMLGEVPINLTGKLTDTKIYVTIDIDMQEMLSQTIGVAVGQDNGFELPDGINNVTTTTATAAKGIYTLGGLRVNSLDGMPKGVYVVNGKKIIK